MTYRVEVVSFCWDLLHSGTRARPAAREIYNHNDLLERGGGTR